MGAKSMHRSETTTEPPAAKPTMRVLMISESVPPQVNGMARRIGHYTEGLEKLGCEVTLLDPDSDTNAVWGFANPWNFAARMMVVRPLRFFQLLSGSVSGGLTPEFDVVHAVMPLNLSSVWLLAGFKFLRGLMRQEAPVLIVSWHCVRLQAIESPYAELRPPNRLSPVLPPHPQLTSRVCRSARLPSLLAPPHAELGGLERVDVSQVGAALHEARLFRRLLADRAAR